MGYAKVLFMFLILALVMAAADEACSKSSISGHCKVEDPTETNHRLLAGQKRYISYEVLKHNAVLCKERGRSYYGCGRAGPVNPYTRGCSVITRCRRIYD
ncbi:ralf-like 4, RAPID ALKALINIZATION FACTOR 4 [Hibiscus trionum]|uniref:Ralf-like 4, RAPID ALKALINIZATION FACTOR 4 n=1 Tax=Hibiscus trionum TaxID=183268 RepID=A0A9W7LUD9_HIBTR|nr:ralf-like 4, RAPID ALKALINIZATION FACTOR 4 [Hibiscus trionum]